MGRYLTEFAGTFFLVFTIGLTVLQETSAAPLAIGAVLAALVYMGAHVSGAHYNPAISIVILLRGQLDRRDLLPYIAMQIAGATAAALMVRLVTGRFLTLAPGAGVSPAVALAAESLFAFALSLVILNVATSPHTRGNSYYGLAIGFVVMAGAGAVGDISGGAFNPAVGTGPILVALAGGGPLHDLWIYWVGPVAGAALAVPVYRMQHARERQGEQGQ
ncbi:MAG: aquaporin [Gemmatimonadota bacterium]|nr:aquaporin [Gemmatimonadota bacterium]MDE2866732.1 aquaporin [Gemmatimonadota bacterium]